MTPTIAAGALFSMPDPRKGCKSVVRVTAECGAYYVSRNVDWDNTKHRREALKYAHVLLSAGHKITLQRTASC